MNLQHMKYAVEVAAAGSLNKAAKKLLIGQPNLSRAIKELETSLGVTIFDRSAKGMRLTPEGETFMQYAKNILAQISAVELAFQKGVPAKQRFSISVPRASYISEAFARFSACLNDEDEVEIFYKETNALRAINMILRQEYMLGIIRYAENYDPYYTSMMEEKGLTYETVAAFRHVLIMNRRHPLAKKADISYDDLSAYTEIAHADPFVPSLPFAEVKREELPDNVRKRIFVFERGSQFALLSHNAETFIWASPLPQTLLDRYGLVQRDCADNARVYKDVMIRKKDYVLSPLDHLFIEELCKAKQEILG